MHFYEGVSSIATAPPNAITSEQEICHHQYKLRGSNEGTVTVPFFTIIIFTSSLK
jgi:hypothetical protein